MSSDARVKPEPLDDHRVLQDLNTDRKPATPTSVKPEPQQASLHNTPVASGSAQPKIEDKVNLSPFKREEKPAVVPRVLYTKYTNANEIEYTPEAAFTTGTAMVQLIKERIQTLDIGSKLRKEVWQKEMTDLSAQTTPSTLIAICGATGAGKSSVINAVLDDTIVPTSGMRACTAVVTEISYKSGRSIEADVSFLTHEEWRNELEGLIGDLTEDDGHHKQAADLRGEAAIAWSKVHAVYPQMPQDLLITMTPDAIIQRYPVIANALGTVKKIVAANSRDFGKAIAEYIDSKEKKRGKKDDEKKKRPDGPAWWPLIRTVKVRCPAKALSTGAILVDLPGTADSNAARSSIAQQYMQRCQCIWILAPITRAVDDKVAKDLLGQAFKTQLLMDGNYDTSTVTFIATKTDDLSCNEIVNALRLDEEEGLQEIEEKISEYKEDERQQKKLKADAEREVKHIGETWKDARAVALEYKAWIRALKDGKEFSPRLVGKAAEKSKGGKVSAGKKRKSGGGSPKAKRRKSNHDEGSDMDDFLVEDELDDISDAESVSSNGSGSQGYKDDDSDDDEKYEKCSNTGDDDEVIAVDDADEEMVEEETVDSLKEKLKPAEEHAKEIKKQLDDKKEEMRAAAKQLSKLKDKLAKAQREKNGFCSKARNEYSRDALKEDWRSGIKEMDQEAAMQRDPTRFDPTQNQRDYNAIDLPTFTVSSRDYIRITRQVEGDGGPTCFSDKNDTQIPQLQDWCHELTVASRERSARALLTHLTTFAAGVKSYVNDMNTVSEDDRAALRDRWASERDGVATPPVQVGGGVQAYDAYGDPVDYYNDYDPEDDPYGMGVQRAPTPTNPDGVAPTLNRKFEEMVRDVVESLKDIFREGLEEKLQIGSDKAAKEAVQTSESFAGAMHWATYRATLKRDGIFRRDLNAELCLPMTSSIAQSWAQVFEQDLFADFNRNGSAVIEALIEEIKEDAAPGLRDRTRVQGELAKEDTKMTMKKMMEVMQEALQREQKEISRSLSPNVQAQMREGYIDAMLERGTGSVARQKNKMHSYVKEVRNDLFEGASQVLLSRLDQAAEIVGVALIASLEELSRKIEVDMSVLWENVTTSAGQIAVRHQAVGVMEEITQQLGYWMEAEKTRRSHDLLTL